MMYYSDDESNLSEESIVTFKKEAAYVVERIRSLRTSSQWKKASIIAIVRAQSVPILRSKCNKYQNSQWRPREKPPILVTSDTRLCGVADEIAEHPRRSRAWALVISGLIPDIHFNINATFDKLYIVRVNKLDPDGMLLVSGRSTWNGTELDEWQKRTRQRKLTHNKGVSIFANNFGSGPWSTISSNSFGDDDRRRISSHLQQMANQQIDGSWWESVKGPIAILAAISGLAVGTCKAFTALTCSAKGIFMSLKCGPVALKAGGFSFKMLVGLKVAAPPVAVGVGVACLIYFVPWNKFFTWLGGWLKSVFSGLWDNICSLWDRFWSMFLNWSGQQPSGGCKCGQMGPFS
ncbi:hypothetical protein BKA66DRAFT_574843 [Pyrenochaeta sp. MPI-SDFR-AT-0127]|nr:hypothetical protein BKA66DRAFT_574843 [Pyrenochaeta sp. MPI-SDFR-AT-0127]